MEGLHPFFSDPSDEKFFDLGLDVCPLYVQWENRDLEGPSLGSKDGPLRTPGFSRSDGVDDWYQDPVSHSQG